MSAYSEKEFKRLWGIIPHSIFHCAGFSFFGWYASNPACCFNLWLIPLIVFSFYMTSLNIWKVWESLFITKYKIEYVITTFLVGYQNRQLQILRQQSVWRALYVEAEYFLKSTILFRGKVLYCSFSLKRQSTSERITKLLVQEIWTKFTGARYMPDIKMKDKKRWA